MSRTEQMLYVYESAHEIASRLMGAILIGQVPTTWSGPELRMAMQDLLNAERLIGGQRLKDYNQDFATLNI